MDKKLFTFCVWITILYCTLPTMKDFYTFITDNFTPLVSEDKNGMVVTLHHKRGTIPEGRVWMERAKKGWTRKPLSKTQFIIVNADLMGPLDFIHKFMSLDEGDYEQLRKTFISIAMETIDKHLGGGTP